jgi:hypothetical protein
MQQQSGKSQATRPGHEINSHKGLTTPAKLSIFIYLVKDNLIRCNQKRPDPR